MFELNALLARALILNRRLYQHGIKPTLVTEVVQSSILFWRLGHLLQQLWCFYRFYAASKLRNKAGKLAMRRLVRTAQNFKLLMAPSV